jgi:RNA polymerase sigma-70 factor (ECF subfamily)
MNGGKNPRLPDANSSDDELAIAARKDPHAFALLYHRYLDRVYRYAFSKTSDPSTAEELTSSTFLDALEGIHRYRPDGSFAAWLFTIARRRCADYHRRSFPLPLIAEAVPGFEGRPEEENDRKESFHRLEKILSSLSEEELTMLRLRYAADLSHAQIGQIIGKSEAASKMALSRLIRRLRTLWEIDHGR